MWLLYHSAAQGAESGKKFRDTKKATDFRLDQGREVQFLLYNIRSRSTSKQSDEIPTLRRTVICKFV